MADDTSTTDTAPPAPPAPPATDDASSPADLGDAGKQAIDRMKVERDTARKEAKANADAAKRLAALEESQKTETQKLIERAELAERRASEIEGKALRADVALTKGLTSSQAKRLVGTTEAELLADADELLADIKAGAVRGAVDQGVKGEPPTGRPAMNDLIRAASGRS